MTLEYDKIECNFIEKDSCDSPKIKMRIYARSIIDREWFQADVALDKNLLETIKGGLTHWQEETLCGKIEVLRR